LDYKKKLAAFFINDFTNTTSSGIFIHNKAGFC